MFYVNNLVYLTREYTNLIFHLTIQTYNIWQNMAYADHVVKIITIKSVIHYCFSAVKRKHNMHVGIFYKCLYIVQMYSMATIWIWLEYIIYNFLLDNEHISSKLTNYLRANVVCVYIILKICFFFFFVSSLIQVTSSVVYKHFRKGCTQKYVLICIFLKVHIGVVSYLNLIKTII